MEIDDVWWEFRNYGCTMPIAKSIMPLKKQKNIDLNTWSTLVLDSPWHPDSKAGVVHISETVVKEPLSPGCDVLHSDQNLTWFSIISKHDHWRRIPSVLPTQHGIARRDWRQELQTSSFTSGIVKKFHVISSFITEFLSKFVCFCFYRNKLVSCTVWLAELFFCQVDCFKFDSFLVLRYGPWHDKIAQTHVFILTQ